MDDHWLPIHIRVLLIFLLWFCVLILFSGMAQLVKEGRAEARGGLNAEQIERRYQELMLPF